MSPTTLYNSFDKQVHIAPDAQAIQDGSSHLSYVSLRKESAIVARALCSHGNQSRKPVCVLFSPGADQVICQLAVLQLSGACFLADPSLPRSRLQSLLRKAQVRHVLSSHDSIIGYRTVQTVSSKGFECHGQIHILESEEAEVGLTLDRRVSHLLHTSGSTGEPKLVQITARAILHLATSTKVTPLRPDDKTVFLNSPSFDLALFEVWATLLSGAEIVVLNRNVLLDPKAWQTFCQQFGITVAFLSTGHFNLIAHTAPGAFSNLRLLITAGSAANPHAMSQVFQNNPPEQLWNAYGPAEATTFVTLHRVCQHDTENESIPIGTAVGDMQIHLLDQEGRVITKPSEVGEICIQGPGLSLGYLDNPEETEKKFIQTPLNGADMAAPASLIYKTGDLAYFRDNSCTLLEFVGRNDRQVKHDSHRVELEEIENVIRRSDLVLDAHVIQFHRPSPDSEARSILVACILARDSEKAKPQDIRAFCKKWLSPHMVPGEIIHMDDVPLGPRGKVDYEALTTRVRQAFSDKAMPSITHDAEQSLKELWTNVLGIASVDHDDDFFLLGASSLQAAQLTVKIQEAFGKQVTLQKLYENSQLSRMATYLESKEDTEEDGQATLCEAMKADACLADHFTAQTGPLSDWTRPDGGCILITGATGFVGAFFLHQLLTESAPHVPITCLVRAQRGISAEVRLRQVLEKYKLWEDKFSARIHTVEGNLATPRFGLNEKEYEHLAATTSVLFHFGAHVNFCQRYQDHFDANILGTKNVLHFVSIGMPKSLHYASTIDAWGATGLVNGTRSLSEDEPLEPHIQGPLHDTGYSQSQWVAEQMVRRARQRGFPVAIYRLGTVICDSRSGVGNPNDFFARVMVGCAQLGRFPLIKNLRWEYVTVDYVCKVIYHICQAQSNLGRSYSIVSPNPRLSVSLEETAELLHAAGYQIEKVPYDAWMRSLDRYEKLTESPLLALMPLIRETVLGELTRFQTSKDTPVYRTDNTFAALKNHAQIEYTPLSTTLIQSMFKFWVDEGYHVIH